MKGAIWRALNEDLEVVDDLELGDPRPGEVKVKLHTSGVCHSDLSVMDGTILTPAPAVLGHEGAGVVEAVGDGVSRVAPGDHVVISWVAECGSCWFCVAGQPNLCEKATLAMGMGGLFSGPSHFSHGGSQVNQMAMAGTFAEYTIVPEGGAVKIDPDVPLEDAALVGCSVTTGVGAVFNTAKVEPGQTVAVVGAGGVGLNVIQGAAIAGASRIFAIDKLENKLEIAGEFGATDAIDASKTDPIGAVKGATGGRGADVTFEVIGLPATMTQTYMMARRGGTVCYIGVAKMTDQLTIPAFLPVFEEKAILGSWYGTAHVHRDMPLLLDLYKAGRLKLKELISAHFKIDQINDAISALRNGEVARGVINYE